MPMNPRLLRPTSSTLDADAAVYLNAVAQADGQQLEPAVRKAINDFVVGCKRDGIWDAIKASCILAGARTLAGALVPLKGSAPTNNNFVSGDYNRETGLVGDGSTKYLTTGLTIDEANIDNASVSCWITSAHTGASAAFVSAAADSVVLYGVYLGRYVSGSRDGIQAGSQQSRAGRTIASQAGFHSLSAEALDSRTYFFDGQSIVGNTNAEVLSSSSEPYVVFRSGELVSGQFSNPRIAFFHIGEKITAQAELYNRVSALITAIGAAI